MPIGGLMPDSGLIIVDSAWFFLIFKAESDCSTNAVLLEKVELGAGSLLPPGRGSDDIVNYGTKHVSWST